MSRKIFISFLIWSAAAAAISTITVTEIGDIHVSAEFIRNVALFLLVFTGLSALISSIISRRIVRPISKIDPDKPTPNRDCPELDLLVDKLRRQNNRVNRQVYELSRNHDQFSLITENMDEGIIIADKKLNILTCNSGAMKLLGIKEISVGQSIYSVNNSEVFRRCIQNAAGGLNSECTVETSAGESVVIASPAGRTDTFNGIFILIMDITEKRKLETMRREFTSNVSHELKTPLTTIYGISDMLAGGLVKSGDASDFGARIRNEADRLIKLINDIMALSKLDEAARLSDAEEINLYVLSAEILERLSENASERNITLKLSGDRILYTGNRTVLDEVIYNLCDNGVKYNNDGGILEVNISRTHRNVVIIVSDSGIGIPKEHIDRIFERFYRVDKSRSGKIKGTGLGLSIVKHGVMYHGGTVRAESAPGKGTVFTITLPDQPN